MKINKNKIILGVAIVGVLVGAFLWGGDFAGNQQPVNGSDAIVVADEALPLTTNGDSDNLADTSKEESVQPEENSQKVATTPQAKPKTPAKQEIDPKTGKDKYKTDPVPKGKPAPVEPQSVKRTEEKNTCTLKVSCKTILANIDDFDSEKKDVVPKDGIIFATKEVSFNEGESVFNVLQREMKKAKIHFEFVKTPVYNSAYIEGINNIYEFDCGELSGWMYSVNGWFPNYGCSRYQLAAGDVVELIYTCDLGRDIGSGLNGFQKEE